MKENQALLDESEVQVYFLPSCDQYLLLINICQYIFAHRCHRNWTFCRDSWGLGRGKGGVAQDKQCALSSLPFPLCLGFYLLSQNHILEPGLSLLHTRGPLLLLGHFPYLCPPNICSGSPRMKLDFILKTAFPAVLLIPGKAHLLR